MEPVLEVGQGFGVGQVVDEDYCRGVFEVEVHQGAVDLLARGVEVDEGLFLGEAGVCYRPALKTDCYLLTLVVLVGRVTD